MRAAGVNARDESEVSVRRAFHGRKRSGREPLRERPCDAVRLRRNAAGGHRTPRKDVHKGATSPGERENRGRAIVRTASLIGKILTRAHPFSRDLSPEKSVDSASPWAVPTKAIGGGTSR